MSEIKNSPRRRLKIYVLLGTRANLEPTGGDVINEARFLETLSQFAARRCSSVRTASVERRMHP